MEVGALNQNPTIEQPRMRAKDLYNPIRQTKIKTKDIYNLLLTQKLITDLGEILDKNPIDG